MKKLLTIICFIGLFFILSFNNIYADKTMSRSFQFGGTIKGDLTLDDGSGDSPSLILKDGDNETLTLTKLDAGGATITNSEGSIDIIPGTSFSVSSLDTLNGIVQSDGSGNLSSSIDLPDGTTATTQSPLTNDTTVATTAYVDTAIGTNDSWDEVMHTGNTFTVLDTESLSATINQNDTTNNPAALIINNTGSGNDITLPNSSYIKNGTLVLGGDVGLTGTRVNKGWFNDIQIDNININANTIQDTSGGVTIQSTTQAVVGIVGSGQVLLGSSNYSINMADGTGFFLNTIDDVTIGAGSTGIDYELIFKGESSNGSLQWMEDEAEFRIGDTSDYVGISIDGGLSAIKFSTSLVTSIFTTATTDSDFLFGITSNGTGKVTLFMYPEDAAATKYLSFSSPDAAGTRADLEFGSAVEELDINHTNSSTNLKFRGKTDDNLLFLNSDDNRVGIGTGTPDTKLHVVGNVTSTTFLGDLNGTINTATTATTQSPLTNNTTVATTAYVDTAIGINDSWDEVMHTGNTFTVLDTESLSATINQNDTTNNPAALIIDNTGSGNDITLPNNTHIINGTIQAGESLRVNQIYNRNSGTLHLQNNDTSGDIYITAGTADGNIALYTGVTGTVTVDTDILYVDGSSDMVGIGTVPSYKLHVLEDGAVPIVSDRISSSTNSVLRGLELHRSTSGTAVAGIGAELAFRIEDSGGNMETAATVGAFLNDVTPTAEHGTMTWEIVSDSSLYLFMQAVASTGDDVTLTMNGDIDINGQLSADDLVDITRSSSGQYLNFTDGTDTFGLYNNAGTPESVISADIGSLCTDTTNGELYIKTIDTVATGWVQFQTGSEYWQRVSTNLLPATAGDDIGSTGTRINKGWFTDIEITNYPTISGTALSDQTLRTTDDVIFNSLTLSTLKYSDTIFEDEMWNGIESVWATDVTTGSKDVQSRDNGWYRLTTGAVATNEESIDWNDIVTFTNTKRPTFEARINLEEINDTEVEVGLKESEAVGSDDYIMIAFDPSAQNTWYCTVSNAGSTTTDQGSIADTNEVLLRFQFNSDTAIEWFIDDVSQGTIATNIPTVGLQPFVRIRTEATAAHYVEVDSVKLWQDRS